MAACEQDFAQRKVAFFYNHDACHQVFHTATVMEELARTGAVETAAVVTSRDQLSAIVSILGPLEPLGIGVVLLIPPLLVRLVLETLDNLFPASRLYTLAHARRLLASFDALVVTETTSTLLKSLFKMGRPRLIWLPHGAGDRAVGFGAEIRWFDHVLLSGPKVRNRMLEMGLIEEDQHEIVGYPKFDAVLRQE